MNFAELYINNKQDAEQKIATLWGAEANTEGQKAQVERIKEKIDELFAPEDAVPVVQCMNSYRSVYSVSPSDAEDLVGGLWRKVLPKDKYWAPYEHQYKSWNALLHKNKDDKSPNSICVTTGTGSGKTECFMMPLVHHLSQSDVFQKGEIQAIFLYPLNALMEDQKERLEKLLAGTDLTYTVYNGDLPEDEPSMNDDSEEAERERMKIDEIRGIILKNGKPVLDANGEKQYKYPKMVYTRKAIRNKKTVPNILLTNPTMLEYILLRKNDKTLICPEKKSLKWIVLDETHTYSGAGATEMAMLLRRVMIAFDVDAHDVRFATSSATFVNKAKGESGNNDVDAEIKLKTFISDLTGTGVDQVKVITGERENEECLKDANLPQTDKAIWTDICKADYIRLDELFHEGNIESKLKRLDEMCQRIENLYEKEKGEDEAKILMKCKVHYFYRVPNNGLYVRLSEVSKGAFDIYTQRPTDEETDKLPLLELCRCKKCGAYLAVGNLDINTGKLTAVESDDIDMFDLGEETGNEGEQYVFALSNTAVSETDHTSCFIVDGHIVNSCSQGSYNPIQWHLVGNSYKECPCCCTKLTKYPEKKKEQEDTEDETTVEDMRLQKLRLSSEFISRTLAPSTLEQLDKEESKNSITLHDGQQYLSFVDSRQAAATATMNQNLEQERLWFYTTIYKALIKQVQSQEKIKHKIDELNEFYDKTTDRNEKRKIDKEIVEYENKQRDYLTWEQVADEVYKDSLFDVFCRLFVKKTEENGDLEADGTIKENAKYKYLYSLMVLYLGKRPLSAASPENLGLFRPCYPFLSEIKKPASVDALNDVLQHTQIEDKDWQNLIQVFIDYTIRSNQSVFLRMDGENKYKYDIFACERYATEKPSRRAVHKPKFETRGKVSSSRIVRYISGLITKDLELTDDNQTQREYYDIIKPVIDDFWLDIEKYVLQTGTHYNVKIDPNKQIDDTDTAAKRFNLSRMCFSLYNDVYLCDVNKNQSDNHTIRLRPVQNNFMGFSPYLIGKRAVLLEEKYHDIWECFDGYDKKDFDVEEWAKEKRKVLWDNGLWGKDGVFADRLTTIHETPNLFIQAEHTAQVDKMIARQLQNRFKDHSVNVLACSTTMEMGVDLGNLEVVMLTSVPPSPANYKQRAGRSGRNNKVKSACITLCSSDAIGLRTLRNPIDTIIARPTDTPRVDFTSNPVVIRHVIAYLIREFGVFSKSEINGGSLNQKVADFYTQFRPSWVREWRDYEYLKDNNDTIQVSDGMGIKGGAFMDFDKKCFEPISKKMQKDFEKLLDKNSYLGNIPGLMSIIRDLNQKCYENLEEKVENIKNALANADPQKIKNFEKYKSLLNMKYQEIMRQKLLNFWPTHRFTPNANMPVNVVSLDLNPSKVKESNRRYRKVSNPSYSLRQAISQYVPGNSLVIDGVSYIVRGLTTQDEYTKNKTIKKLYHNANKTVIGESQTMSHLIPWSVNGRIDLDVLQPVRFLPDPNETESRTIADNRYTHVSAQLIGTTDWGNKVTDSDLLFSTRVSDGSGYSQILYYNEGIGYGYAICLDCGKMCIEEGVADEKMGEIPRVINDRHKDDGTPCHYAINRVKGSRCSSEQVKRNVIIGDMLQTDYCEIRIRHDGDSEWINFSTNSSTDKANKNLLTTLGIAFTQALIELKGWERGSVDFAVMQNRHLCIFDTNPGGSGYSTQLRDNQTMMDVIEKAKILLKAAKDKKSKDMILDKFTIHYLKDIDIPVALNWISEQELAFNVVPASVASIFKGCDVHPASGRDIFTSIESAQEDLYIFVNDEYNNWDYGSAGTGWQGRAFGYLLSKRDNIKFCVSTKDNRNIPEGAKVMLRSIGSLFGNPVVVSYKTDTDIYPLAYIKGRLYFTMNKESAYLDSYWADGTLYSVKTDNPAINSKDIDLSFGKEKDSEIFQFACENNKQISSKKLGELIYSFNDNTKNIINRFLDHCNAQEGNTVKISYLDDYNRSKLSMVLSLQVIEYFVRRINSDFTLEFFAEEYYGQKDLKYVDAPYPDSYTRDKELTTLTNDWLYYLNNDMVFGRLIPIESKEYKTLPHWRVLTLTCAGKKLSIYPDGGFLNGWKPSRFDKDNKTFTKSYRKDNVDTNDEIYLDRIMDIKFDVLLEADNKEMIN